MTLRSITTKHRDENQSFTYLIRSITIPTIFHSSSRKKAPLRSNTLETMHLSHYRALAKIQSLARPIAIVKQTSI